MMKACRHCGAQFEAERSFHVYCSKDCRTKWLNANWKHTYAFPSENQAWRDMKKRCNNPNHKEGGTDPDPYCEAGHDQDGKIIGDDETGYNFSCSKCGAALHSDKPAEGDKCLDCVLVPSPLEAARKILVSAAVGSCTCNTKSPELIWHTPDCRYVLIMMALENVEISLQHVFKVREADQG